MAVSDVIKARNAYGKAVRFNLDTKTAKANLEAAKLMRDIRAAEEYLLPAHRVELARYLAPHVIDESKAGPALGDTYVTRKTGHPFKLIGITDEGQPSMKYNLVDETTGETKSVAPSTFRKGYVRA